jgi:hypothetical protein
VAPVDQATPVWRLDRRARVALSDADLAVIECFVAAHGEAVAREALLQRLGRQPQAEAPDGLNATIYRRRRHIERATPASGTSWKGRWSDGLGTGLARRVPVLVVPSVSVAAAPSVGPA